MLVIGFKIVTAVAPFAMPATGATSTLLKVVQGIQKVRDQHMGEKPEMLKQIDSGEKNIDSDRWRLLRKELR